MVEDAQLSPQVVTGTQPRTGFKQSTFRSEGERANQYTTIASTISKCFDEGSQNQTDIPNVEFCG